MTLGENTRNNRRLLTSISSRGYRRGVMQGISAPTLLVKSFNPERADKINVSSRKAWSDVNLALYGSYIAEGLLIGKATSKKI